MKTLKQIYDDNFASYGASLRRNGKEINFRRILFLERARGYTIAIPCSKIKDQETLDDINNRYTVCVHYGIAPHYQMTDLDVSKCIKVNNSKDSNAERCYFSCDNLSMEDAIELYERLILDNL